MAFADASEFSISKLVAGPVIGSDLVPLKRVKQSKMTSYNKKRERRERHLKQMLKQHARMDTNVNGMISALFELAANSADLVDKTMLEFLKQVM